VDAVFKGLLVQAANLGLDADVTLYQIPCTFIHLKQPAV